MALEPISSRSATPALAQPRAGAAGAITLGWHASGPGPWLLGAIEVDRQAGPEADGQGGHEQHQADHQFARSHVAQHRQTPRDPRAKNTRRHIRRANTPV